MEYIDLKQNPGKLEEILSDIKISQKEANSIKKEISYYDKYIILKHQNNYGFIKIWTQHFSDPWLDLKLEKCDLISFKGLEIPNKVYIDVLNEIFNLPQITRCLEKDLGIFENRGFERIKDKKKYRSDFNASTLVSVIKEVNGKQKPNEHINEIRLMRPDDLPKIEKIFSKEYAARYRAVNILYNYDPTSCFVYDDGSIKGVIFGEKLDKSFYIHQIFVKKKYRAKDIDKKLLNYAIQYTQKLGKSEIRGSSRGNLLVYYLTSGFSIDWSQERSIYIVRYSLKKRISINLNRLKTLYHKNEK